LSASLGDFPVAQGRTGKSGALAGWKAYPTLVGPEWQVFNLGIQDYWPEAAVHEERWAALFRPCKAQLEFEAQPKLYDALPTASLGISTFRKWA
jgi:hypothetical protein